MRDDELRDGLDKLLRPAREAPPPGLAVIRRRLRRRRIRASVAGVVAAAATGVVAVVVAVHGGRPPVPAVAAQPGGPHQVAYSYKVSSPVSRLDIDAGASSVTVTGGAANTPVQVSEQVSYSRTEPELHESVTAGTLDLGYSCPAGQGCGVSYDVQVPAGLTVMVNLRSGSIDLAGLSGPVIAATGTGTINAALASTNVSLTVQTGDITANLSKPPLDLAVSDGTGSVVIGVPGTASYDLQYNLDVAVSNITIKQDLSSPYQINVSSSHASSLYIGGLK